jgi:hypothetical protein
MARPYGGRPTCEGCKSIDIRRWHREGRLRAGQCFPLSWTRGGEPFGSIWVIAVVDAVFLMFQSQHRGHTEGKSVLQHVPITWTACRFGGRRAWFRCDAYTGSQYCGRRVAMLYSAGEVFACRLCYCLTYASQHEAVRHRGLGKARKIRMRLGGGPSLFDEFPAKPKGMHQQTYVRLRHSHDVAAARCTMGLTQYIDRLSRR